jgi:hypothetical protein
MTLEHSLRRLAALACAAASVACNVRAVTHDECHAELEASATCAAAALVVMSDFGSTQVALSRLDGQTLCGSFISSARSETTPVSFALSGDVVLPSSRPPSGRAVLLDRYGTNVVSFLTRATGAIEAQLPLGTGFEANIQDYLEVDERLALVSRWDDNPVPGQQPFDEGGDLLLIDTLDPAILERVSLPREDDFPPHPAGLARVGDTAVVTLQRFSRDVKSQGDAMLVGVALDDRSVAWTLTLDGLKNCGALTLSPDGTLGALACTGFVDRTGKGTNLDESGLVVFDLGEAPPRELTRLPAESVAGEPIQSELEFFAPRRVLVKTQTALGADRNNRVLALDLDRGADSVETVLEAEPSDDGSGEGVVYGGLLCTPGCGDTCLIADADRGVLQRFTFDGDALVLQAPRAIAGSVGLPPRDVGGL